MNKKLIEKVIVYLVVSLIIGSISCLWASSYHFKLPPFGTKAYFHKLSWAMNHPDFLWIVILSLGGAFLVFGVIFWLYYQQAPEVFGSHVRGSRVFNTAKLKRKTLNRKDRQIAVADIPIPLKLETLHFMIGGRTGTGKTVAIKEMLSKMIPRGDRVIIADPNGDFLSHFYQKGDAILNPFDRRSPGWSIFNELNSVYDHERFAKSVIPPSRSPNDAEWHGYAQLLLAETTKKLFANQCYTTKELTEWLTLNPAEELAEFLSGTAAAGLFDPGAAKALASTRFIIANYMAPHQYLKAGDFSLKEWLKNEKAGNLYITWREDMADALRPLISTWLDILCTSILSLPPSEKRRIWIIIDELASLERLNSLEAALTKGRKHGLRIITGLQSTAQLDYLYGREKAITLRSCFSNLLILGGTASDAQTAEDFSRGLGEQDLERIQSSTSQSRRGRQKTQVKQRVKERIVLPSEITNLPTLTGYLSLAGDYPIAKIKLKPVSLPKRISAFEE